MKLRTKITATVSGLMILLVSTITPFTYYKSNNIVISQSEAAIKELTQSTSKLMSSLIERETMRAQDIANWPEVNELLNEYNNKDGINSELVKKINEQLQVYIKSTGNMESSSIVDVSGRNIANSSVVLTGRSIASTDYFKKAQKENKPVASDISTSEATGGSIITFIYPVNKDGKVLGYVSNTIISDTLMNSLKGLTVLNTKSGYVYVTDATGKMLYHPTKDKIGKPVENEVISGIVTRIKNGEKVEPKVVQYDFKGTMKFASYTFVPETNWILVLSADVDEVQVPIHNMTNFILILGGFSILISCILLFLLIFYLTKPLDKITSLVNKTADFDFIYDKKYEVLKKRKDETGIIAKALENMIGVLRQVVVNLKQTSEDVTVNSQKVFNLTEKMYQNTQDNSATTEELSAGMEETAASSEEITSAVDEMEEQVKIVVGKTEEGALIVQEIHKRAQDIRGNALNSAAIAKDIYNETKIKMESAIEETKTIQQINVLADAILGITKQTNLLALNAAIEAARAGEAGKGFAVVSDQIRQLAEQSSKTASDIQKIVQLVNSSVENITSSSGQMLEFVDKTVLIDYDRLIQVSEKYNDDANTVNEIVTMYNSTANDLSTIIENISTAIREVVKTAYESAQGVQDIAAKTTEIVYSSEEIEKTAKENTEIAKLLEDIVKKFKLD